MIKKGNLMFKMDYLNKKWKNFKQIFIIKEKSK